MHRVIKYVASNARSLCVDIGALFKKLGNSILDIMHLYFSLSFQMNTLLPVYGVMAMAGLKGLMQTFDLFLFERYQSIIGGTSQSAAIQITLFVLCQAMFFNLFDCCLKYCQDILANEQTRLLRQGLSRNLEGRYFSMDDVKSLPREMINSPDFTSNALKLLCGLAAAFPTLLGSGYYLLVNGFFIATFITLSCVGCSEYLAYWYSIGSPINSLRVLQDQVKEYDNRIRSLSSSFKDPERIKLYQGQSGVRDVELHTLKREIIPNYMQVHARLNTLDKWILFLRRCSQRLVEFIGLYYVARSSLFTTMLRGDSTHLLQLRGAKLVQTLFAFGRLWGTASIFKNFHGPLSQAQSNMNDLPQVYRNHIALLAPIIGKANAKQSIYRTLIVASASLWATQGIAHTMKYFNIIELSYDLSLSFGYLSLIGVVFSVLCFKSATQSSQGGKGGWDQAFSVVGVAYLITVLVSLVGVNVFAASASYCLAFSVSVFSLTLLALTAYQIKQQNILSSRRSSNIASSDAHQISVRERSRLSQKSERTNVDLPKTLFRSIPHNTSTEFFDRAYKSTMSDISDVDTVKGQTDACHVYIGFPSSGNPMQNVSRFEKAFIFNANVPQPKLLVQKIFYGLAISDARNLSESDLRLLLTWDTYRAIIVEFLETKEIAFDGIDSTATPWIKRIQDDQDLPAMSGGSRAKLTAAVLYAILKIPHHMPHYRFTVSLEHGFEGIAEACVPTILEKYKSAVADTELKGRSTFIFSGVTKRDHVSVRGI